MTKFLLAVVGIVLTLHVGLAFVTSPAAPDAVRIKDGAGIVGLQPVSFACPQNWSATPGVDPDTKLTFTVCTSPDKRFIITARENRPAEAFDTQSGTFVDTLRFY